MFKAHRNYDATGSRWRSRESCKWMHSIGWLVKGTPQSRSCKRVLSVLKSDAKAAPGIRIGRTLGREANGHVRSQQAAFQKGCGSCQCRWKLASKALDLASAPEEPKATCGDLQLPAVPMAEAGWQAFIGSCPNSLDHQKLAQKLLHPPQVLDVQSVHRAHSFASRRCGISRMGQNFIWPGTRRFRACAWWWL